MRTYISAIIILAILSGCSRTNNADQTTQIDAPDRPNILLIVADDMGYTDIGSFGGEIRTPNLDQLAYDGVRLTNFRVHPSCAPTRGALMSGTHPHVAGIGTQLVTIARYEGDPLVEARRGKPGYESFLNQSIAPIPALLQNAGYRTYMAGKWHIGESALHSPKAKGFDRSFDLIHGSGSHFPNTPGHVYREDGEFVDSLPEDYYSTKFFTDKIIAYIEESRNEAAPWFAYLAYTTPHWPLQVPDSWLDKYENEYNQGYDILREQRIERAFEAGVISEAAKQNPGKALAQTWNTLSETQRDKYSKAMEIYAAMVENMDYHVGRTLEYLRSTGQLDNTIILFMSDNGAENFDFDFVKRAPRKPNDIDNSIENFGRANSFILYGPGWAQAGMGPFAYHKGTLGEGGIRAAAFVNNPNFIPKGKINDTLLTVRDLSATILQIAGVKHPTELDPDSTLAPLEGESFWSMLSSVDKPLVRPGKLFIWEHDGQVALIRDGWKYIRLKSPHGPRNAQPGWHLFNLTNDPGETTNVASENPELVAWFENEWKNVVSSGEIIAYPD